MNGVMAVARDHSCNEPNSSLLILYYFQSYAISCFFSVLHFSVPLGDYDLGTLLITCPVL